MKVLRLSESHVHFIAHAGRLRYGSKPLLAKAPRCQSFLNVPRALLAPCSVNVRIAFRVLQEDLRRVIFCLDLIEVPIPVSISGASAIVLCIICHHCCFLNRPSFRF